MWLRRAGARSHGSACCSQMSCTGISSAEHRVPEPDQCMGSEGAVGLYVPALSWPGCGWLLSAC